MARATMKSAKPAVRRDFLFSVMNMFVTRVRTVKMVVA